MAYIGRDTDKISNIEKLDTITFDGSSSYTLQKNSVNFTPNSANSLQVSIDGVVQAGNFTVSGSTIDFGVAIPSTSTNDFIFHYGTGLVTTVADGAITTAKLGDASVTSAKLASGVGGKLLQVVTATDDTQRNTTSTSFVTASNTLSVSITPASASNKVFITVSGSHLGSNTAYYTIYRDSTNLGSANGLSMMNNGAATGAMGFGMSVLDSPNSTSAITYQVYLKAASSQTARINNDSVRGTITAFEIEG